MKKRFNLLLPIFFLVTSFASQAQQEDHQKHERKKYANVKQKDISKTYPAPGNSLSVVNGFGDVKVTTWDKNEIKVDIHIEVSSDNKDLAEQIFDKISVTDNQEGNKVSFKTENKGSDKTDCKDCHSSMSIDYTIQMPANNTLSIQNSFGDIVVPDYNGAISLDSKFGSLTAGKLQKTDELNVEFGNADIKSVSNVDAKFKFSSINIDQLGGNNKIYLEFCGFTKLNLASDLTGLDMKESYSTVNLRPAAGLTASYHISTNFGSVVDRSNIGIKRTDKEPDFGPDFNREYEGGSGSVKIEAKSSFGKIIIGEATADDMKEINDHKRKVTRV